MKIFPIFAITNVFCPETLEHVSVRPRDDMTIPPIPLLHPLDSWDDIAIPPLPISYSHTSNFSQWFSKSNTFDLISNSERKRCKDKSAPVLTKKINFFTPTFEADTKYEYSEQKRQNICQTKSWMLPPPVLDEKPFNI